MLGVRSSRISLADHAVRLWSAVEVTLRLDGSEVVAVGCAGFRVRSVRRIAAARDTVQNWSREYPAEVVARWSARFCRSQDVADYR